MFKTALLFFWLIWLTGSPLAALAERDSAVTQAAAPSSSKVLILQNPLATEAFEAQPEVVKGMVQQAITNLVGNWRNLADPTNVIGIKVYSLPGARSGTRPAVAAAIVESLIGAGFSPSNIVVWDKHLIDLRLAGFTEFEKRYGIRVQGSADAGYDPGVYYESPLIGNLVWGDLEFGKNKEGLGRKSYVSKLLSRDIQKIINITPLLNHNVAGVSGNLYSLATGSVDNTVRFEMDAGRLMEAVPEIYALEALSDKVVLNITDALICQYEGGERGLLHYSVMLDELRFSKDPVALDVLSLQELERQRKRFEAPPRKQPLTLYSNAGLLELGEHDLERIQITRIQAAPDES